MATNSVLTCEEYDAVDHMIIGGKVLAATGLVAFAIVNGVLAGGFLPDAWDGWFKDVVTLGTVISAAIVIWTKFLRHITRAAVAFVDGVAHVADLADSVKDMKADINQLRVELASTIVGHDRDISDLRTSVEQSEATNAERHKDLVDRLARIEDH